MVYMYNKVLSITDGMEMAIVKIVTNNITSCHTKKSCKN